MNSMKKTITYATVHHQGNFRKSTSIPYIVHLFNAMYALKDSGINDEDILEATILHDIIENTSKTFKILKRSLDQLLSW